LNNAARKVKRCESTTTSSVLNLIDNINYTCNNKAYIVGHLLEAKDVRILISSTNVMKNLVNCRNLRIDATYKLVDLGYSIIVIGTSDVNRHFILIGLCIASSENAEIYAWMMQILRIECQKLSIEFTPANLIADSAPQIDYG